MILVVFNLFSCSTDSEEITKVNEETKNNKIIIDGDPIRPVYVAKDIFVCGRNNNNFSVQWKNDLQTNLTGYSSMTSANGTFVTTEGDVYTAGSFNGSPVYWKNGILNTLPCTSGIYGEAKSIFVSNGNVYVAGLMNILENTEFTHYAAIWVNGVPTKLSNFQSQANSIYVSGYGIKIWNGGSTIEERYIKARYWRGTTEYLLPDDNQRHNKANSIYVDAGKVYIAGGDIIDNASNGNNNGINIMRAKYWINRTTPIILNNGLTTREEALSISAKGDTVLLSGWSATSSDLFNSEAVYWYENNKIYLTNNSTGLSSAKSIFVTYEEQLD